NDDDPDVNEPVHEDIQAGTIETTHHSKNEDPDVAESLPTNQQEVIETSQHSDGEDPDVIQPAPDNLPEEVIMAKQ
ncbi:hypothetical protein, partial [Salmonella sp. s51944]|uniref:hypothetical protein n=1 Tax=Salmonella sp. s51944 TaxID=3159655 RepID=UPI00397EB2A1